MSIKENLEEESRIERTDIEHADRIPSWAKRFKTFSAEHPYCDECSKKGKRSAGKYVVTRNGNMIALCPLCYSKSKFADVKA